MLLTRTNKFSFTDLRLQRLKPENRRRCCYDLKCPGLELRISPSGYKVFSFVLRGGKRERLGQFPPLTVKIAREVANEKRLCAELGIDPVQRETLGELWTKYRSDMAERNCRHSSIRLFERCFRGLDAWKHRRLDRITRDMVRELLDKIREGGEFGRARNTAKLLSAMTHFAIRRGWSGKSSVAGIAYPKVRCRTRFIEPHELSGFITTLEERKDVFGDLILTALFTGVRRGEVQWARWADVSLKRRRWAFTGKGDTLRTVYLSDYVLEIFRRRRSLSGSDSVYVFENPFTDRPLGWVRRVMYRAEMAARDLPADTLYLSVKNQFSMHTLRHSFITYGLRAGVPLQVLQKMAGHTTDPRVTVSVYAHSTEEWEREGFQKVADLIRELAGSFQPDSDGKERTPARDRWEPVVSKEPPVSRAAPENDGQRTASTYSLVEQKSAYLRYFQEKQLVSGRASE